MTHEPSVALVRRTLKTALYSSDPWLRAEATARLEGWELPVAPAALSIATRRLMLALDFDEAVTN